MVLYPDNPSRIQRVKDLSNDIAGYQDEIKQQNEKQKLSDQNAYETLGKIAKMKGYSSPEDYIEASINALPEVEKKRFQKMREEITKTGATGDTILFVSGAVATLSMISGALCKQPVSSLYTIASWVSGLRASATSVELSMTGAISEADLFAEIGEEAFKEAEFTFGEIGSEAGSVGTIASEGMQEVSLLVKVGRFVSRAVFVLAILATIGGLIYEGVEGKKQMEKCQTWIKELCAKRFMVYKLKDNVETAFTFMSKIYGLLEFEKMVREDEDLSKEKQDAKIKKKTEEVAAAFAKLPVPNDDTVYGALRVKDEAASSWTNEDPKLSDMKKYLQDLKDGKIKPES